MVNKKIKPSQQCIKGRRSILHKIRVVPDKKKKKIDDALRDELLFNDRDKV